MRRFFVQAIVLLAAALPLRAQQLAYVYIQGDKQIPFYVKLEGAMQERYGKNYSILSQMAPGPTHIDILFQQNAYPPQSFIIQVPEGGARAFLLTQRNGAFSLYDLQQHFYLPAGNKEEEDRLPARQTVAVAAPVPFSFSTNDEPIAVEQAPAPASPVVPAKIQKPKVREKKSIDKPAKKAAATNNEPHFLTNIELNNRSGAPVNTEQINDSGTAASPARLAPTFRNSDCPQAMDNAVFEQLYKRMIAKSTDEERISFLNDQLDKCYLTWQARTLGTMLAEDAARYMFLKKVYPRITDQQEFPLLDDMLRSEVWKTQFNQLVHP